MNRFNEAESRAVAALDHLTYTAGTAGTAHHDARHFALQSLYAADDAVNHFKEVAAQCAEEASRAKKRNTKTHAAA
jgi:hypothetical protein